MDKVFISVKKLALLFNCSPKTVYTMPKAGIIPAKKLTDRKTLIRLSDINNLFEPLKQPKADTLTAHNCYTIEQIINKYKVSRNTQFL